MSGIKQTNHIGCENVGQRIPNVSTTRKIAMPYLNIILKAIGMIEYTKYRYFESRKTYIILIVSPDLSIRNRNELIFPTMIRFGAYGRTHKIDI